MHPTCSAVSRWHMKSHGSVVGDLPPHTLVLELNSRSLWVEKEYPGRQTREERAKWRLVPIQPSTLTHSRGGIPGWAYTEVTEDKLPHEIHVFITVCKVFPLAMPAHSGIINELFTVCILLPATLSLASSFSFFFCPISVIVLLPIVEGSAGKVHLNGKDICISEHSIAVIIVLGHRGDKTLELEHDVLHCSGNKLGSNQVKNPLTNSVKAAVRPPLPALGRVSYT